MMYAKVFSRIYGVFTLWLVYAAFTAPNPLFFSLYAGGALYFGFRTRELYLDGKGEK